jgi:hypothetical protein
MRACMRVPDRLGRPYDCIVHIYPNGMGKILRQLAYTRDDDPAPVRCGVTARPRGDEPFVSRRTPMRDVVQLVARLHRG